MEFYHISVMLNEAVDALAPHEGGTYFDGTLGGGGHSLEIMKRGGKVIATDLDGDAIAYAQKRFEEAGMSGRYVLVRDNFKNAARVLDDLGVDAVDGALLDLGVSSHQFDAPERGFSYRYDAPLDMRMDTRGGLTAKDVVNDYPPAQLLRILYEYGEESYAKRIVAAITAERKKAPIETTGRLAEIVERSVPHRKGGHPAKKTFQAIRIEVNGELDGLGEAVETLTRRLKKGGRICVITFHSLEDKTVKRTFARMAADCICDRSLPVCVCGHKAEIKLIKVPKKASEDELESNSRSRSASIRIAEKL